jgi:hypothetical protein
VRKMEIPVERTLRMKSHLSVAVALALSLVVVGGPWAMAQGGPVTGAIFTTLADGSAVNLNHFDSKCAVYLDGGPGPNAPARAAGLPDGDYYFQVTDPSGRQLLSTDVVSNRRFKVTKGVIVAYTGIGGPIHPTGIDLDHPELGAITIRLANASCPSDYLDSPNNGGAYKVWATPVGDFVGDSAKVDNDCGNGCFHGFLPAKSKTDNFKARAGTATFCLTVQKQILEADGTLSPGGNWQIRVTDPLGVLNTYFTDEAGQATVCGLTEGAYTVTEILPEGWEVVNLIVSGVTLPVDSIYAFTWTPGKPTPVILFRNRFIGGVPG